MGAYAHALQSMAHSYGLEKQAKFLGVVPAEKLVDLLNSADIFCMPSPEELQSIASLEAMACARPLLVSNARALPELVSEDVNGCLFEPGNPQDAARKIEKLLAMKHLWPEMGRASHERALKHDITNTIRRYEEIYLKVLGTTAKP